MKRVATIGTFHSMMKPKHTDPHDDDDVFFFFDFTTTTKEKKKDKSHGGPARKWRLIQQLKHVHLSMSGQKVGVCQASFFLCVLLLKATAHGITIKDTSQLSSLLLFCFFVTSGQHKNNNNKVCKRVIHLNRFLFFLFLKCPPKILRHQVRQVISRSIV